MVRRIAPTSESEEDELASDPEPTPVAAPVIASRRTSRNVPPPDYSEGSESEADELQDELEESDVYSEAQAAQDAGPEEDEGVPKSATSGGFKIKLKMSNGSNGAPSPTLPQASSSRAPSVAASATRTSTRKRKRGVNDMDDDGDSDESATSSVAYGRMTARQRAKELGNEAVDELVSLPMVGGAGSKKKQLTEAEVALKKSEDSRKRKAQVDQKLEAEKQETINRLLKKQAPKSRSNKTTNESGTATPAESKALPPAVPTMIRYISSIKSGEFVNSLSLPVGKEDRVVGSVQVVYPAPRPALKSRRLR